MELKILTRDDLRWHKGELLIELQKLISPLAQKQVDYLKRKEVKKLLKISDSTLQSCRDTGKIKATKVGGIYFYPRSSIENLFSNGYKFTCYRVTKVVRHPGNFCYLCNSAPIHPITV